MQGLLSAALAFARDEAPEGPVAVLSLMGVLVAVSLGTALGIYSPAVRSLSKVFRERIATHPEVRKEDFFVVGREPPPEDLRK